MGWSPRWGHLTQLHRGADGSLSGWNDCWEACLARYLRERDGAAIEGDDWALIDSVGRAARGTPDAPDNAETSLGEAARSLTAFGVAASWTESYQAALAAPWAICLVDGATLRPAQYPAGWFGAAGPGGDHFILWLPFWRGGAWWFNDPLAFADGQQDCRYDLASVAAAFVGAYLLPSTGNGESAPPALTVTAPCALKAQPNHTCIALAWLAAGTAVTALGEPSGGWRRVRAAAGPAGWVPVGRLAPG